MTDPISSATTPVVTPSPVAQNAKQTKAAPQPSRAPDPSAINIALKPGTSFDDSLRQGLGVVFGAIYKNDPAAAKAAIDKAVAALKPALADAAAQGASAVQFRVVTVATSYGDSQSGVQFAGGAELGVETALVRSGKIQTAQNGVVDLGGNAVGLSSAQIADGFVSGYYRQSKSVTVPNQTAQNQKYLSDIKNALNSIQRTSDVLAAYAKGNAQPLRDLINEQLRAGAGTQAKTI
jgi:hypothetical protein